MGVGGRDGEGGVPWVKHYYSSQKNTGQCLAPVLLVYQYKGTVQM